MSTTSFGCCCRLARTRISAASMTTRRSTWPSPSVTRSRSRFSSMAAPILHWLRGSTSVETPLEMAEAAGLTVIAAMLARKGKPLRQRLRSGLTLLDDMPGTGELVRRQHKYRIRLRLWLSRGEAVRWQTAWGPVGVARLDDNGETLITEVRIDRRSLVSGLFYGVEGMRIGGTRRLGIAPHLAYGDRGVPGVIPAGAMLTAEITILEARDATL